jgi:hypothetical protein
MMCYRSGCQVMHFGVFISKSCEEDELFIVGPEIIIYDVRSTLVYKGHSQHINISINQWLLYMVKIYKDDRAYMIKKIIKYDRLF